MNIKNYRLATENEWLFADDTVGNAVGSGFVGDMARGGNLLFQILTDEELNVVFDCVTAQHQISSLEQVFAAKKPEPPKKAEAPKEQPKAENAKHR